MRVHWGDRDWCWGPGGPGGSVARWVLGTPFGGSWMCWVLGVGMPGESVTCLALSIPLMGFGVVGCWVLGALGGDVCSEMAGVFK